MGCQEQCASHSRPTPSLSCLCLNVLSSGRSSWTPRLWQLHRLPALWAPVIFLHGTPLFLMIALFTPLFDSCLCPTPSHPRVGQDKRVGTGRPPSPWSLFCLKTGSGSRSLSPPQLPRSALSPGLDRLSPSAGAAVQPGGWCSSYSWCLEPALEDGRDGSGTLAFPASKEGTINQQSCF